MTFLSNQVFSWTYWSCIVTRGEVIVRKLFDNATKSLIPIEELENGLWAAPLIHLFHLEEIWLDLLQATKLKSAKALVSTSTPVFSLVVFALLHITNRPIVQLTNQNFVATSGRRNEALGVFIAGVPFPPPPLSFFPLNSLPPPPPPPLYTPAMQAATLGYIDIHVYKSFLLRLSAAVWQVVRCPKKDCPWNPVIQVQEFSTTIYILLDWRQNSHHSCRLHT